MTLPGTNRSFILYIGGARSGKSRLAVEKAAAIGEDVAFIATAERSDPEMTNRIELHRRNRPSHWKTAEAWRNLPELVRTESRKRDVVVIDCLTLLVSNLLAQYPAAGSSGADPCLEAEDEILGQIEQLGKACAACPSTVVMVANEVGGGVVPPTAIGRAFRDVAGRANQIVGRHADEVYWVCAGIPVAIKGAPRCRNTVRE